MSQFGSILGWMSRNIEKGGRGEWKRQGQCKRKRSRLLSRGCVEYRARGRNERNREKVEGRRWISGKGKGEE